MVRLHPLRLLLLVLMAVVWPTLASAATVVQLETRVWGIELVVHALVKGSSTPSPEKHLGNAPVDDEIAPGYSLAAEEVSLAQKAADVRAVLDPIAFRQRTVAALDSSAGRILAGGARDLSPAQRAALLPGEIAAKLPGAHAEVTALGKAAELGATPQSLAVTRIICPECAAAIERSGGFLTSPTTAVWPR